MDCPQANLQPLVPDEQIAPPLLQEREEFLRLRLKPVALGRRQCASHIPSLKSVNQEHQLQGDYSILDPILSSSQK